MKEYYLVEKNGEFFAGYSYTLPFTNIKRKGLFRDWNGDVLSLGTDRKWAEEYVQLLNELQTVL